MIKQLFQKLSELTIWAKIAAIATFVTTLISAISATISFYQATISKDSAKDAANNLALMRESTGAAVQQAKIALEALDELKAQIAIQKGLLDSAVGQRQELARSVEVAQRQTATLEATSFQARRARVYGMGTDLLARQVGYKLQAAARFRNVGQEAPEDISIQWQYAYKYDPVEPEPQMTCDGMKMRGFSSGDFASTSALDWEQKYEDAYLEGKIYILIAALMCYKDTAGNVHKSYVCGAHSARGSYACSVRAE